MDSRSLVKSQPDIFLMLAQNSLTVAKNIRTSFVDHTFDLADKISELIDNGIIQDIGIKQTVSNFPKSGKQDYITACFVDGGIGNIEIFNSAPLIVRGGIFRVKEGEHDLQQRETFEFFPILIGDVEGGEKTGNDYASVIRIIIELSSIVRILKDDKYQDVDIIMLHGPLLYRLSAYSKHWFYRQDYTVILSEENFASELLKEFDNEFKSYTVDTSILLEYQHQDKINANYFISFLLNKAITLSNEKGKTLVGVVERASATEIIRNVLQETFKQYGDLVDKFINDKTGNYKTDTERVIRTARFTDSLILALILKSAGDHTTFYNAEDRYSGFSGALQGFGNHLPRISYTYLKSSSNTLPIRVEMPTVSTDLERERAVKKVYEYSRILPNYAFPIGLDVADKFAKVPQWLTEAYKKYILFNFGRLATDEQLDNDTMLRLLQFYYLNQRDFQYRPKV